MDKSTRTKVLTAAVVVLVVGVVWILASGSTKPQAEVPSGSNYYTGAFRNKKDPNIWGDANGKQVAAPADATPYNPDNSPPLPVGMTKQGGAVGVKPN